MGTQGLGNYELFMRCITSCYVINVPKTVSSNSTLQLLNEIRKFTQTWEVRGREGPVEEVWREN